MKVHAIVGFLCLIQPHDARNDRTVHDESSQQHRRRRARVDLLGGGTPTVADGPNALPESSPLPWWVRVGRQLRSSIIYILLFALTFDAVVWVLEGADGWPFESLAIATILVFNTATAYGLIAGALAVSVLGATISARLTSEKI